MRSSFYDDLTKEKQLGTFLDRLYDRHLSQYTFERVNAMERQHQGIDLIFQHKVTQITYTIDEKAQLDYINEDLPTFAFELSYFKNGLKKTGWLFDTNKKTDFYALITGIYRDVPNQFTSAKITLVNRARLLDFLKERKITSATGDGIKTHGQFIIPHLCAKNEGYLFHSKTNKAETPLNLILRLEFLIQLGVAKRLA